MLERPRATDRAPLLELRGVEKTYGNARVVGPLSFDLKQGEFLTLLGPSGCGKTSTLQIIAGLSAPSSGTLTLEGIDITELPPSKRDMGVVFQSYALFPHKTVFQNVAFGLRMRKVPSQEIDRRVNRMLETVGLRGLGDRRPMELSGGQRQRVALARSLVIEPRILLLDEPLSNLDSQLRRRMRLELRELQRRLGITTILVTHDQSEAFELSDRVLVLNHGNIEQVGSPEVLYDAPSSRFVAEFIGEANFLKGKFMSQHAADGAAEVEIFDSLTIRATFDRGATLQAGDSVSVLIRPERTMISAEPPVGRKGFQAQIVERVFSGDIITFEVEASDGVRLQVAKPSLPQFRELDPGQTVWTWFENCRIVTS